MRAGSRPGILAQAGGILLVTTILLAVIELGAGFIVGERQPPARTPEIPGDTVSRTVTWLELNPAPLVRDADLLWRNEPGARKTQPVNPQPWGRNDAWTIENNSEGLRGPERAPGAAEDAGLYRILCVGDSITFGFNVDQPDAYPRQLQALLEARYPAHRFEVVNSGVPGWSWLQGLRFLELHGLAMRPDLVIMGHGTNDQALPAKVTDEERFHRLGGPATRAARALALRLTETNSYRLVERFFPPPPFSPDRDSPGCQAQIKRSGACRRVSVEEISTTVGEVNRLVSARNAALLLLNLDFVETAAINGLRHAVDRGHLPFLDAVDHLRTLRRADEAPRAERLGLAPATAPAANPKPSAANAPKHVVLRMVAPDRTAAYHVRGHVAYQPELTFAEPAYDDGTHGDERAGDGVYSATITLPATVGLIEYLFHHDDDPELRPLPPMSSMVGNRRLVVPEETTLGPVETFGKLTLMVERAHPDREGQRVIAGLIMDRLSTVPSFQRFVGPE